MTTLRADFDPVATMECLMRQLWHCAFGVDAVPPGCGPEDVAEV